MGSMSSRRTNTVEAGEEAPLNSFSSQNYEAADGLALEDTTTLLPESKSPPRPEQSFATPAALVTNASKVCLGTGVLTMPYACSR